MTKKIYTVVRVIMSASGNSDKALAYFIILLVYLFLPPSPPFPYYLIGYKHPDRLMTLSPLFNALQWQGCSFSLLSADTRGHSARTRGRSCLSCFPLRDVVVSLSRCVLLCLQRQELHKISGTFRCRLAAPSPMNGTAGSRLPVRKRDLILPARPQVQRLNYFNGRAFFFFFLPLPMRVCPLII